jgi:hypothetical protein
MSSGMSADLKLKPSALPARPLPLMQALGLGAAVLLLHLWLLTSAPLSLGVDRQAAEPAPLRMSMRRIEPASAIPGRPAPPAGQRQAKPAPLTSVHSAEPQDSASEPPAASVVITEPPDSAPTASAQEPEPSPTPADAARAAATLQLPGSARLRYELTGQSRGLSYTAEGQLTWQQDGQRYEARMSISGLLLVRPRIMTSVGELGPEGVSPRRFSDRSRTEQATHFQPERGRILFSSNAPEAAWQPGAQDRVSLFFQLAGLLAAEPERYNPGAQVQLLTAGVREADLWTFTVTGTPTLALPAGEQVTIALRRLPRRDYDQTIEIWFAPALGYLPVRIRITQGNGDMVDQQLAAMEPL